MSHAVQSVPALKAIELEPIRSAGELAVGDWWAEPELERATFLRRHWLFILVVCTPVALAIIYFGFIASDQFSSEARFIVRTSAHSDVGSLASLVQTQKLSRAIDETYAVNDYLVSRDSVALLTRDYKLREILARPQADIFGRFPNFYTRDNSEQLYRRFQRLVSVDVDTDSGISTLEVRAFTPQDARNIAVALLKSGEALINTLNLRAHDDALKYAERDVEDAKERFAGVQKRLTQFRNDRKVIDPTKEAAAALGALGRMATELAGLEAALSVQIATTPNSPSIPTTREKISSIRQEIDKQRAQIVGGGDSMASKLAEFDGLMLDRLLASKSLEAAAAHLETARQEAQQQQLYLQTIVAPDLPDQPLYPKRLRSIFFVLGLSVCVYWTLKSLIKTVSEHQA